MTTTFDQEQLIWKKLYDSSLKNSITGKIRKGERPANSDKEDITVKSLTAPNEKLAISVVNVNIYAPDLTIYENGVQEKVADHARLETLTDTAISVLTIESTVGDNYYDVQQQVMIEDEVSKSHFVNIRINFYSIN